MPATLLTPIAPYIDNPFIYSRRMTHTVMVGQVGVGGTNPIRVQSMTTTRTQDVEDTAAQAERLVRVGCEIVRITAPTPADARAIGAIKRVLESRHISVPLVADIHFSPNAALIAADYVDKVRINPGNYADSRKFAVRDYTDSDYEAELERIDERFSPLVLKLKERGVALRIGTNHGSLSDRIMNRFGDTPEGMVESALEFVRICERHAYTDIVLSMKASNPKVMIAAYRLLAARMAALGMHYPFHLGVTEAGNGEDARIKSAIGIGSLLEDGIGDTIRVSLAEEPEAEIPVAQAIATRYNQRHSAAPSLATVSPPWDSFQYARRASQAITITSVRLGAGETIAVVGVIPPRTAPPLSSALLSTGTPARPELAVLDIAGEEDLRRLRDLSWQETARTGRARTPILARTALLPLIDVAVPLCEGICFIISPHTVHDIAGAWATCQGAERPFWVHIDVETFSSAEEGILATVEAVARVRATVPSPTGALIWSLRSIDSAQRLTAYRWLATHLAQRGWQDAVVLAAHDDELAADGRLIPTSISLGALLCDGLGDALLVEARHPAQGGLRADVTLALNVLQGAGTRLTRTDYVACPSCGRTLFDLQTTTDHIKSRTGHLKGVKIAIMGCVVNGPGEMADADFGYVGGSPDHVNLYVGKECVERNVPAATAADRLIDLIKEHGRWLDPHAANANSAATSEPWEDIVAPKPALGYSL